MSKKGKVLKKHSRKSIPFVLSSLVIIIAVVIIASFSFPSFRLSSLFTLSQHPAIPTQTPFPTSIPNVTLTPPPFPNFSQAPVQPKNTFDITTWKQFDDPQIGLRFKYPSAWGIPYIQSVTGDISGSVYRISFQNSNFFVSGDSNDFSSAKDYFVGDFAGFSQENKKGRGLINPQTFCEQGIPLNGDKYIFCQITSTSRIDVLYGPSGNYQYYRLSFINRPGKKFGGLVFGGGFLSPQDSNIVDTYFYTSRSDIRSNSASFANAILQRKLDSTSMKTFDEYEKVFETIQNY